MTVDADLQQAQANFAVANTPLFLVRKLQEDPAVRLLARQVNPNLLLEELRKSVQKRPETLRESVIPYVCLVALWFNNDATFLENAVSVKPAYSDDWFDYIRSVLIKTFRPTHTYVTHVPLTITSPPLREVNAASAYQVLRLDGAVK
jgi:hypothetical protein